MPVPVINTFTSLQLLTVGKLMVPLAFSASESPTSWAATSVPAGLSFNTTTGVLTGTPTTAALSTLSVTATNGTGTSVAVTLPILVEAAAASDAGEISLNLDLDTGVIWNPYQSESDFPGLYAKHGNKLSVALGFVRRGELQTMDITGISAWLRDDPVEPPAVQLFTGAPLAPTVASAPRYLIKLDFDQTQIAEMIQEHADDAPPAGTPMQFRGLSDFTVEWTAPDIDGSGTMALTRTFRNFAIHIAGLISA
jgi:hypothetical protein